MKRLLLLFLISSFLIPHTFFAQERVLLHINERGEQEVITLKKGIPASEVVNRYSRRNDPNGQTEVNGAEGLVAALKNYDPNGDFAKFDHVLHQEVLFQWFTATADCKVKELWWYNGPTHGVNSTVNIRAWNADPKLATRPSSVTTKFMGAYKDNSDGDGGVTPFKPIVGKNQWFYGNGSADSSTWRFDPLWTEVETWHTGTGRAVNVDSAGWQHIIVQEGKDSVSAKALQLFGFTIMNPATKSDIPAGQTETPLDIVGYPNTSSPRHSLKFYENGWTDTTKRGWYLRGDYEWGMYLVVEYTSDRPPVVVSKNYGTTLKTTPRTITVTVTDDNPGGGAAGVKSVRLFSKKGTSTSYDSTVMSSSDSVYSGLTPGGVGGDTIYWYVVATDVNGNRTKTSASSYKIYRKNAPRLLVYNNAQYSVATANLIYTGSSVKFDKWSVPIDGTEELSDACKRYWGVLVGDGAVPYKNIMPYLKQWLDADIGNSMKYLFISSQDYGALIQPSQKDTVFPAGSFERDYLGIASLGPQDVGSWNRPYRVIPLALPSWNFGSDPFLYSLQYMKVNSVTMWYDPAYELGFYGYPDGIVPAAQGTKILLGADSLTIHAVITANSKYQTMFMSLDAGALQFRSDTSLHNANYTTVTDPKYQWIADLRSIGPEFLLPLREDPEPVPDPLSAGKEFSPYKFGLSQNYPNPFNPVSTVEYEIAQRSHVQIELYNSLGQVVRRMVNEEKMPGQYSARIDAASLASGVYFYRMQAGTFTAVKRMIVVK